MTQKRVSITEEEWKIAETASKKDKFTTPTAWIRHIIRKNGSAT